MNRTAIALVTTLSLATVDGRGADKAPSPSVVGVRGHLFNDTSGELNKEDVFGESYVPYNRTGTGFLVVATVDMGRDCVLRQLSGPEAAAVANGKLAPPSRPAACDKPPGRITVRLRSTGAPEQRQELSLSKFFTGEDGKLRVPFLFYRHGPCVPLEIVAAATGQRNAWTKTVNFSCAE
jgi:hypothetical protein